MSLINTIIDKTYGKYIYNKWQKIIKKEQKYHIKNDMYWCVIKSSKHFNVPLFTRLKMYKNGFTNDEYVKYNFKENNMKDYITDRARWKSRRINGEYSILLDDKEVFYHLFKDYVKTPKILGNIKSGKFIDLDNKELTINDICSFLHSSNGMIFRLKKDGGGKGLFLIKEVNNHYEINGKESTKEDIANFVKLSDGYVVSEAIKNAEYSAKIFDKSVNTLRIIVAREKDSEKFEVVATYHRFGCNESIPGDNMCRGGFVSKIDINTGVLSKITSARTTEFYSCHPETGSQIEGVKVPNFEYIKKSLIDISYKFNFLNLIAWDVVVSDDGFEIIEGNASSGVNLFQYFEGIKDEDLGRIFKSYDVL
jgi:hypothetical protein